MLRRFYVRLSPGADRVETSLCAIQNYDFFNGCWKSGKRPPGLAQIVRDEISDEIASYKAALTDNEKESLASYYKERIEELKNTKILMIRIECTNHLAEEESL